ncbi:hypothetical protein HK096_005854 [Nowakowskiella sp. JEL0078]|nr:hypothetical protein HK096_005854 [Nowakowskiella sp. JEL0078]
MGADYPKNIPLTSWTLRDVPAEASSEPFINPSNPIKVRHPPTEVFVDLIDNALIKDPHVGMNEVDVQWIHERTWVYECLFETPLGVSDSSLFITCDGLDTYATVFLNGSVILESDNMFLSHIIKIPLKLLSNNSSNVLKFEFKPALLIARQSMHDFKDPDRECWNGWGERLWVRKAQYHFGWDWGPCLISAGPWKSVKLELTKCAIFKDAKLKAEVTSDLKKVRVHLKIQVTDYSGDDLEVQVKVKNSNFNVIYISSLIETGKNEYEAEFEISNPELWYPRGYGTQNIYYFDFSLIHVLSKEVIHQITKQTGFRRVRLIQDLVPEISKDPLSGGTSFFFEINNIPIFMAGTNWIPASSYLSAVTESDYRQLLKLQADANLLMIRVWGGGLYESETFFKICDELGLVVWQDCMFACGQYPLYEKFEMSIKEEIMQNISRCTWHPSLSIIVGNNEDYQVGDESLNYDRSLPEELWRESNFPARILYERLFPKWISEICGDNVVYWPGSPWGGIHNSDRTIGDTHQWNGKYYFKYKFFLIQFSVWGGAVAPYQLYSLLSSRFISEFGMPSFSSLPLVLSHYFQTPFTTETYEKYLPSEINPESRYVSHHIKAHSYQKRMGTYLISNYKSTFLSLEENVRLTQLLQSDAMKTAYSSWRRFWRPEPPYHPRHCGGALVWQLNDVWPGVSWSIIDSARNPKPAYHTIRRILKPKLTVHIQRTVVPEWKPNSVFTALVSGKTEAIKAKGVHSTPHVYPQQFDKIESWAVNTSLEKQEVNVKVYSIPLSSSSLDTFARKEIGQWVGEIPGNSAIDTFESEIPIKIGDEFVFIAELWQEGKLVARDIAFPEPFCWFDFSSTFNDGVEIKVEEESNGVGDSEIFVEIIAKRFIKGFVLEPGTKHKSVIVDDSGIDFIPGESKKILILGEKLEILACSERWKIGLDVWWYGFKK